jgi:hypothetical protein
MLAQSSTDKSTGPTRPTSKNGLAAALDAIDAMFKDGLRCKLCELYTLVYDTVTQSGETRSEYSAALYEEYGRRMHETQAGIAEAFEELLSECVQERAQCWLEKMVAVLEGQARFAYIFVHGFEYLDRVEYLECLSKPKLRQKAYMISQDTKLKVLAGQTKSAFTDAVCAMAGKRGGAASWRLVRDFANAWQRLFGTLLVNACAGLRKCMCRTAQNAWPMLLTERGKAECNVQSVLSRHRYVSISRLAVCMRAGKSMWTPEIVILISEYTVGADDLHAAYGVKSAVAVITHVEKWARLVESLL